jgi:hypothetical protein
VDVDDAEDEVVQAQAVVDSAEDAVQVAQVERDQAQQVFDAAEDVRDEKAAIVAAIEAEIELTEELVDALTDRQVFAMNRSLHNARVTDLTPFLIGSAELQAVLDGDYGNPAINALITGFEAEARFDRLAARFEEKAAMTGEDHFLEKAEFARAKAETQKQKFLDKSERLADVGKGRGAKELSRGQAKRAASEAAAEAAQEVAAETAVDAASDAVDDAVQEAVKESARSAVAEERRAGAQGAAKGKGHN